jgi:AcrR family transcriptional regulator
MLRSMATRRRSKPKRTEGPETRLAQIIRNAAELFDRSGYANASMEDIAEAVGLAKPTLYHYVKSKDEIVYLIHREFMTAALNALDARMSQPGDAAQQLRGIVIDIVELVALHRPLVRVFFEHFRELPASKTRAIVEQRDRYMKTVERVIRRGIRQREFVSGLDPTLAALAVFGICDWTYQWLDPRGRLSPRAIGEAFSDVILEGITPRKGRARK